MVLRLLLPHFTHCFRSVSSLIRSLNTARLSSGNACSSDWDCFRIWSSNRIDHWCYPGSLRSDNGDHFRVNSAACNGDSADVNLTESTCPKGRATSSARRTVRTSAATRRITCGSFYTSLSGGGFIGLALQPMLRRVTLIVPTVLLRDGLRITAELIHVILRPLAPRTVVTTVRTPHEASAV